MKTQILLLLLFFSCYAFAQTPSVTPVGDVEEFAGSQVCVDAPLVNSGPPGFGPYIQLIVPIGVSFDSAEIFGSSATITNVGTFPAAPGNQLNDTIINQVVTAPEGFELILIQPPIGSLVNGAPPLNLELCFTIDAAADIGIPLGVSITPVFELGDTATGDNGPIIGATEPFNITPILVEFTKENNAPEGERPPGPSWPVSYTLTADIAPGATLDNVALVDVLPANFVIDSGSLNVAGGTGCVFSAPDITLNCPSTTGTTSANDLVVTYSGFFSDVLDEAVCDSSLEINNASLDADYLGSAISQESDTSEVSLQHITIQKGAGPAVVSPGDTVTYNLNLQVTDFGTSDSLILTDVLPDGVTFGAHVSMTVGGAPVAIVPTVTPNLPAAGQTTVVYDVTAAAGNVAPGTAINVVYNSTVDVTYDNGDPLLANDPLTNTVVSTYGLTAGAAGCTNGSGATITVQPTAPSKTVISTGPYAPGDAVTYRLTLFIPSGDTQDIVFTDFFPLPVFDVNDINLTFGTDITLSPVDTLGLTPSSISIDGPTNSLVIAWPNVTTGMPQTLSVDVDVRITTDPFADDLNLANLLQIDTANTPGTVTSDVVPVNIEVRAPDLIVNKGVVAADQGTITPPPATLPVDGDVTGVDAGDAITFQLTIENIGGAQAFDVFVADPAVVGLTNCALVSVEDGLGTALTTSAAPALDPGFTITTPLSGNDDNPVGGGDPYSTDTAIVTYTCEVDGNAQPEQIIENTASVIWASETGGNTFPPVEDTATTEVAAPAITKSVTDTAPDPDNNDATVTIGETVQYTLVITVPEGQSLNTTLTDTLDNGLVFQSFDSIVASSGDLSTNAPGGFPGVLGAATGIGTRNAVFDFGDITNSNADNATIETITIVYTVLVTDIPQNINGRNRNNNAAFNYDGGSVADSASNVRIREPNVTITKSVMPMMADAGDTVTYTVLLSNTGTSDAFNVEMTDLLADANLTLVDGSVTTTQGTVTTGNGVGDTTVAVDVGTIPFSPVTSVTVTFDVTIANGVPSGEVLQNTASVSSESLPVGGRVYGPTSDTADLTINAAEITKIVLPATSTEQSGGISGQGDGTLVDLTIGEEVTFRVTATLAEGVSPSVIITDTLPGGATGLMEVVSSTVVSVGANLTPTNTIVAGTVGPANVVVFDFGSVSNAADGTVDGDDRIVVEVTAVVVNDVVNSGLEVLTNNVMIQYNAGLSVSGSADVEVVEPRLGIDKSSPTTTADAGDTITFTLVIANDGTTNSSANAFDVTLTDTLPAGFTFAGNLSFDAGLAPDVGTLQETGGTISAFWSNFTLGSTATISFDVTVDIGVAPEQIITNTAGLIWDSLPGGNTEERNGTVSDSHEVMISAPGLNKVVFTTSEPATGTAINGPEDDVAVGETVTYQFTVTFPEGTSLGSIAADQLPTVTTLMDAQVVGTQIISIGGQLTVPNSAVPPVISDSDADTYNDLVTWNLGDVVNTPDGVSNANDQIVFQVVAILVDDPVNQGGLDDVINTATFTSGGVTTQGTALIDVVTPVIEINKETVPASITADAGDTLTYRITIDHDDALSTSDAFNFTVTDTLPNPGTSWVNDATVVGSCLGVTVDSSGDPTIEFTFATLPLATDSCTIEYQVIVDVGVNPNETYQNTVDASWTSTSIIGSQTRTDMDMDDSSFVTPDPAIIKTASAANTSLNDTGDNVGDMLVPDMAIGELIDFNITVIFPEGTTTNAVVVDQLPLVGSGGVMELVAATVDTIGASISTSLPGTAVIVDTDADTFDDNATLDFGTVTNIPDGLSDANDQIIITITARVVDVTENMNLDLLTNSATFTYGAGTVLNDTADVEVVTPALDLTKAMGPMANGVVPITLTFSNTGDAPAYDILIEDILDTNVWDISTITAVTIPTGFLLSDAAGPGASQHTVSIASDGAGSPPATSIEPAEVLVFTFNVALRDDVALPSTIPNTATVSEASTLPGADPSEQILPEVTAPAVLTIPLLDSDKSSTLVDDTNASGGASPGEILEYSIVLSNSGDGDANNVVITDVPDINGTLVVGSVTTTVGTVTTGNTAGDALISIDVGTLAAGTSVTIVYRVTINDPLPAGVIELTNQGLIESDELPDSVTDDPGTGPNDDPTVVPVDGAPDLTISKDDGGVTASGGVGVVYTLTYANVGTQDATGVVITETVPANTTFDAANSTAGWVCVPDNAAGSSCTLSIGNLGAGDPAATAEFAVLIDSPLPAGVTEVINAVTIADDGSNGPDPTPNDNGDTDDTPISDVPDFVITKDDGGATAIPGGDVTYVINYSNVGGQNATGVVITETVPANSVFNPTASSAGWLCLPDNNPGSICTFAVGNLSGNGASGSVSFTVTVDNPLSSGVIEILNTVSIADDGNNGADPTPDNNTNDDNTPINAAPDFVIAKTDGGVSSGPGQTVVYTISYDNVGNQNATGVVITETVPANTTFDAGMSSVGWVCVPDGSAGSICTFIVGNLNVGGGSVIDFAVLVDDPLPTNVKVLINTVSIGDDGNNGADPNPNDNTGSDNTPLGAAPDLTITKDDGGVTAITGSVVVYAINYANIGNQQSTGVVITETVPMHSTFNPGSSTAGWTCAPDNSAGSTCTLAVGTLNGGGDAGTASFAVDVVDPLPAGVESILNSISIGDDGDNGPDADPNNNNDNDDTPVDAAPDLTVTKVDRSDNTNAGGSVIYDISYSNIGSQDATGVVITETVPTSTSFDAASSSSGWVCLPDGSAGSTCTFAVGALAAGEPAVVIQFAVQVDNPVPAGFDTITNNISIGDDGTNGPDEDPNNNNDDEITNVGAFPDLMITKTDGNVSSGPGQTIIYTLNYANVGDQNATGVLITETVPANTSFNQAASSVAWNCLPNSSAGSVCEFTVGDLDAGDSGTVTFAVDVDDPLPAGVNAVTNTVSIGDDGANGPDTNPENNVDNEDTSLQLEPPVGIKTGVINGNVIDWTFYWFNPNNNRDLPVFVFDPIPNQTQYVPGSATCTATGTSSCTMPVFNAGLNQIELNGVISPDEGAAIDSTVDQLNNEIVITFSTRIAASGAITIFNQAEANWDENNDGDPNNDADNGQTPVVTDAPQTPQIGDPTVVRTVLAVPIFSWWGMLLLIIAMSLLVWREQGRLKN